MWRLSNSAYRKPFLTSVNYGSIQARGLMGAWPMNNIGVTTGRTVFDATGRLHATALSTTISSSFDTLGPCLSLANGYLETASFIGPTAGFSCTALINPNSATTDAIAAQYTSVGTAYFQFSKLVTSGVLLARIHGTTGYIGRTSTVSIPLNTWTHVAFTWDGGFTSASIRIYINGQRVDTTNSESLPFGALTGVPYAFRIGNQNSGSDFFGGKMLDVRIYNQRLSESVISQMVDPATRWELYNVPRMVCYEIPEVLAPLDLSANFIAHWPCDETGAFDDAIDVIGSADLHMRNNTFTNIGQDPINGTPARDLKASSQNALYSDNDLPALAFDTDQAFTYILRFRIDFYSSYTDLFSKNDDSDFDLYVYWNQTDDTFGEFNFEVNGVSDTKAAITSTFSGSPGDIAVVAFGHDPVNDKIWIRFNNNQRVETSFTGGPRNVSPSRIVFGDSLSSGISDPLDGAIGPLSFWKRSLSDEEIDWWIHVKGDYDQLVPAVTSPINLINTVTATPGANGGTTAAIDTTGANLIIISVSWYNGGTFNTLTDSKGNTWIGLTIHSGVTMSHRIHYCLNPTVGSGHTFTAGGSGLYPAIIVNAYSGVVSYHSENGGGIVSGATLATGNVTPSMNDSLIYTAYCGQNTVTDSIAGGYTLISVPQVGGNNCQGATAWLVQGTAAAINPTWAFVPSQGNAAAGAAVFLSAVAATDTRITQDIIELISQPTNPVIRTSQYVVELLGSTVAPTTIQRVQGTSKINSSNVVSTVITFSTRPTVGNGLIVFINFWRSATQTITSCVDNNGNTYTLAASVSNAASGISYIYYCPILTSTATGASFQITLTASNAVYWVAKAVEYSGIGLGLTVDTFSTNSGNSTAPNTNAVTAITANEVIQASIYAISVALASSTVVVASPIWTEEFEELPFNQIAGEADTRITSGSLSTTPNCSWTTNTAAGWGAILVVFKTISAAPASTETTQFVIIM